MPSATTIIYSLLGGVLPALFWLWFWLKEDRRHPEPRRRISLSFVFGMIAVIIVLPIEKVIFSHFGPRLSTELLAFWASVEELSKFAAAYFAAIHTRDADEPVDFVIYMVTAALGFSALENSLFLANLVGDSLLTQSIISGNMRFLGATLLHIITSATVGSFMAVSFYRDRATKRLALAFGIMFAIALHTAFNFFIINMGQKVFLVFGAVWLLIIALLLMFEKIKKLDPADNTADSLRI